MKTSKFHLVLTAACTMHAGAGLTADPDDGIFDAAWSDDGKVVVAFDEGNGNADFGSSAAIGSDGSMYIAGLVSYSTNGTKIGVVKRDPLGEPSAFFSQDGKNTSNLNGIIVGEPVKIAITKEGNAERLLVAATLRVSDTRTDIVVCKFNALTGVNLDFAAPTLPYLGCTRDPLEAGVLQETRDIVVQPDGKFIVVGTYAIPPQPDEKWVYAVRFNADGSIDDTFDSTPKRNASFFASHEPRAAMRASNGKIVIVGSSRSQFASGLGGLVMRLNSIGTLDEIAVTGESAFGLAGSQTRDTVFKDLVLEPDPDSGEDAIIAVGHAELTLLKNSAVIARLAGANPVTLDTNFGESEEGGYSSISGVGLANLSYESVAAHPCSGYITITDAQSADLTDILVNAWTRSGSYNTRFGETAGNSTIIDFFDGLEQFDRGRDVVSFGDGVYVAGYASNGDNADFAAVKLFMDSIFCDGYQVD